MNYNMDNPPPYSEAVKQPAPNIETLNPTQPAVPKQEAYNPEFAGPPRVVVMSAYGPDPQLTTCPSCHARIKTRVEHKPNTTTHLMAVLLLILFWPCALYPYCTDSCQDAHHYCPNCGSFLGVYQQN